VTCKLPNEPNRIRLKNRTNERKRNGNAKRRSYVRSRPPLA